MTDPRSLNEQITPVHPLGGATRWQPDAGPELHGVSPTDADETPEVTPVTDAPAARPSLWARFIDRLSRVPLRSRIGLLVMAAVGLAVAAATLVSYFTVEREVVQQLDQNLQHDAAQVIGTGRGNINVNARFLDAQVVVYDPQGDIISNPSVFNGSTMPSLPKLSSHSAIVRLGNATPGKQLFETVQTAHGPLRVLGTSEIFSDGYVHTPGTLVVAQSMAPVDATLTRIRVASLLVGLAGIAVAGFAGFGIGRTGLRPVDDLTEATEHVAHTGELRPIEVHGKDEVSRLATSFNAMLGALARSREHQRRLVADAGHELRTPLTSMRTNLDLLAQSFARAEGGLTLQDRDELIGDVRAQLEELSVLVADLVELSRDEPQTVVREHLDLADVVRAAIERVRRRALGTQFEQRLAPWYVYGESAALERAVTNLLDNAAKWSPAGGTVTITLHDGLLEVADEGPGIAEEDLGHVFERFYRSPEARTMPGSGLGLSIVRQAAEHHGGKVAAARAPGGGALLGMWLPGSPTPPPPLSPAPGDPPRPPSAPLA